MANLSSLETLLNQEKAGDSNKRVEKMIQKMKNKGIDTSKYFSLYSNGRYFLAKVGANGPEIVDSAAKRDKFENEIFENGYIKNTKLFRRFIFSQVYRGLKYHNNLTDESGFTAFVKDKGYMYTWKMLVNELRIQNILFSSDTECFNERSRWFGKSAVYNIAADELKQLEKHIENSKVRRCRGREYKTIYNRMIFVDSIEDTLIVPRKLAIVDISNASNPRELYNAAKTYAGLVFGKNMKISTEFMSSYKGLGAFYSLKNMILFHGCNMTDSDGNILDRDASMDWLNAKANDMSNENGYKLFGILKEYIEMTGFNLSESISEHSEDLED